MPYRHLTLKERRTIFRLPDAKRPVEEIARQLGHRTTPRRFRRQSTKGAASKG